MCVCTCMCVCVCMCSVCVCVSVCTQMGAGMCFLPLNVAQTGEQLGWLCLNIARSKMRFK